MAYQRMWDHMAATVKSVAEQVRNEHPDAWDALTQKSPAFAQLVVLKLRSLGFECATNAKRGNPRDISCDIVNFRNGTGARDVMGQVEGIELRDFITAAEDPIQRHLNSFGDSTPDTIANTQAGWVVPGGSVIVPQPPNEDPVQRAVRQIDEMAPKIDDIHQWTHEIVTFVRKLQQQ